MTDQARWIHAAALAALLPGLAHAQTDEPRFTGRGIVPDVGASRAWDDMSTDVYFANNRVQGAATETYGWSPSLSGRVLNGRDGDTLIVTIKKGRTTVGSHRCPLTHRCDQRSILTEGRGPRCAPTGSFEGLTPYAKVESCRMDEISVQSDGEFDFELAYEDANTGDSAPLRTLRLPVVAHAHMLDRQTRRHAAMYVPLPRDMVGSSWIEFAQSDFGHTTTRIAGRDDVVRQFEYFTAMPTIHFWALNGNGSSAPGDAALRCKVDGTPVTLNQSMVRLSREDGQQGEDWRTPNGNDVTRVKWGYNHYALNVPWRVLIKENDREAPSDRWSVRGISPGDTERHFDMTEHPGSYECSLVLNGAPVRAFKFSVDAHRGVVPHEAQQRENGIRTTFGRLFIETVIPAGTALDEVFNRDAARASGFFGKPWPASVASMLAAFPPSTRTQSPPNI